VEPRRPAARPPAAPPDPDDPRPQRLRALTDLLTPTAVRLAVSLGVPDVLAAGPRTADAIADCCGTDPRATLGLLRRLVTCDVLEEVRPRVFALGELGEPLLDDHLRAFVDLDGAAGHLDRAWAGLGQAVRTGTAAYPQVFGRGFWDHLAADPALAASFDSYMDQWAAVWVPAVAPGLAARAAHSVVDVGGGTGGLLAAVLEQDPTLFGTLVEQEASAERARERFTAAGLDERTSIVEGSFFDALPPGEPLYVLAQVVHDWPDDAAVAILRRCAEALPAGGRVLLVERVPDPDHPTRDHVVMDLRMLVVFGARERTRAEFAELARRAGLVLTSVEDAAHGLSFVELRRTG
jgi:SAM-dependent methyltransferase